MNWNTGIALAVLAAFTGSLFAEDDQKITERRIIRTSVDKNGKVTSDFANATGGAKTMTAINYKVMWYDANGNQKAVDETKQEFKVKEKFVIEIEAITDCYVYIFAEGPDGERVVLVPNSSDADVPFLKRGEKTKIPSTDTLMVQPPVGQEKLLIFATPEKQPTLTPKDAFEQSEKQKDKKKLDVVKTQQDKVFADASNKKAGITITATTTEQLAKQDFTQFRHRGFEFKPVTPNVEAGKEVSAVSYSDDRPNLFLEIKLTTKE